MSHLQQTSHLLDIDPQTAALIAAEERRQREKIILIPSESLTPAPVREALGSVFTSVYAEGYPRAAMMAQSPEQLADLDEQLASYRRYADRRFYKGAEIADIVESLAGRRAAECFATPEVPAERIYANVQPLSGAAANLAVYDAFVNPGDTVMGMALTEGGHLTHGSEFNVTGKRYRIVSYAVDPRTGQLDYKKIRQLAEENRPRMIIGGFTSYPWQPDWARFREIADSVGAILLADVAHTAGMIIGGVYPNPIGHAHVVSFTTHKTLCGPRGAIILSTSPKIAGQIDKAIFPGQQGGPHVNKFAAIAVALKLAQQQEYKELQQRIIDNASHLASALESHGLTLAYGGTNTHLLLVDLRTLENETGFVMLGEIASRILDLAGIVCNKNTLPGDNSAADAHGIRLGTPWITQRGMGKEEMEILAKIIADVLHNIRPFSYPGLTGELSRGKLPLSVLEQAKRDVRALVARIDPSITAPATAQPCEEGSSPWSVLRLRTGRPLALLNEAVPTKLLGRSWSTPVSTYLFDGDGELISDVLVGRLADDDYAVLVPRENLASARAWLTGLAEGYTLFDPEDLFRKVQGPAVIEQAMPEELPQAAKEWLSIARDRTNGATTIAEIHAEHPERFDLERPYFVGQAHLREQLPQATPEWFSWSDPETEPLRTPLYEHHVKLGARLVPFAGWEMPVWYTSALEEHAAVRKHAGLFDLGHMGVFQVEGDGAAEFLNAVTSNYASWLEDGQSQYAYLLDPDGGILDDIMIYRREQDRYLVVVNASNENKDWAWLTGLNEGRFGLDRSMPARSLPGKVTLRNLKSERSVIDIALQGPKSVQILAKLLAPAEQRAVAALARTEFCEVEAEGRQLLVARTGYTGEPAGYEIYVGGKAAIWLWERLLEVGAPLGLLPCGLASRDSTRTEAGLPLYGHELEGSDQINPFEAGFGSYVKLHKPFFIGREHCVNAYTNQAREIVRFAVEPGARPVRQDALLLDRNGLVLGHVTSSVSLGETQVGLALVERRGLQAGTPVSILNPSRAGQPSGSSDIRAGQRLSVAVRGNIIPRFAARGSMPQSGGE